MSTIFDITSQVVFTCVQGFASGAVIAKGVGNKGKGGGDPIGKFGLLIVSVTFGATTIFLQGSRIKFRESSPLSIVAKRDKREIVVIHIVAEVIKAVRRPHLSTTTRARRVLKTLIIPRAIEAATSASSAKSRRIFHK